MRLLALIIFIFNSGCSVVGIHSEEQPKYELLESEGDFEVRRYSSYVVAKVSVTGEYKEAQNKGFRILANYIFGGNNEKQSVAMTAPVLFEGEQRQKWIIQFMMPSKYQKSDLPRPSDPRIEFVTIPEKVVASVRYSWYTSESKNKKYLKQLNHWLKGKNYQLVSEKFSLAGYNPPWTLPFFRRNEVHVHVREN